MEMGFIGLGAMGEPMARNLLRAGHALKVYNRTRSHAEALASEGATLAETPAAACTAGVVDTMLAVQAAAGVSASVAPSLASASAWLRVRL